ncbi:MAG: hypothetical protein HDT10_07590 [Helicobacter sp.]|nr:hypothetical protein [Helicobacter sp.]
MNQKDIKLYPYEQYNCEIAFTQKCASVQDNLNPQLLAMWKNIYDQPFFEIHHPTYNEVKTRAIFTYKPNYTSLRNAILFVDRNYQYPFVILNAYDFASAIITLEYFFINERYSSDSQHDIWYRWRICKDCQEMAKSLNLDNLCFQDASYSIDMACERPAHYFQDTLYWYQKLKLSNEVQNTPLFFRLNTMPLTNKSLCIALRLGKGDDNYDFIVRDSLASFNHSVDTQDKLDRFDKEEITMQDLKGLIATQEQREAL